jgi:hypothetical protein
VLLFSLRKLTFKRTDKVHIDSIDTSRSGRCSSGSRRLCGGTVGRLCKRGDEMGNDPRTDRGVLQSSGSHLPERLLDLTIDHFAERGQGGLYAAWADTGIAEGGDDTVNGGRFGDSGLGSR